MTAWVKRPPRPLVMAHRGDVTAALENTLAAFAAAEATGAECIELDVRITADKQLIVFHDPTLARLAGRGEEVEQLPLDELRRVRLSRGFSISTLDEVLDAIGPRMLIDIEIKSDAIGRYSYMADLVIDSVRRHDAVERCLVSSFDPFILIRSRRREPRLRLGYLFLQHSAAVLTRLIRPYAVHPINHLVTPGAVDTWRRKGYAIHPWTVDGSHELRRLQRLGVDAVCTNKPAKALALYAPAHGPD